jgi:hypothetical protein
MNRQGEYAQVQDATVATLIEWADAHSLVRALLLTSLFRQI